MCTNSIFLTHLRSFSDHLEEKRLPPKQFLRVQSVWWSLVLKPFPSLNRNTVEL